MRARCDALRGSGGSGVLVADFGDDAPIRFLDPRADCGSVARNADTVKVGKLSYVAGSNCPVLNRIARREDYVGVGTAKRTRIDVAGAIAYPVRYGIVFAIPILIGKLDAAILFEEDVSLALLD